MPLPNLPMQVPLKWLLALNLAVMLLVLTHTGNNNVGYQQATSSELSVASQSVAPSSFPAPDKPNFVEWNYSTTVRHDEPTRKEYKLIADGPIQSPSGKKTGQKVKTVDHARGNSSVETYRPPAYKSNCTAEHQINLWPPINHTQEIEERDGRKPNRFDDSNRVRQFVFHALHKTGSDNTRNHLKIFCELEGLRCLTYPQCGHHNPEGCHAASSKGYKSDELYQFTVGRLCDCCKKYEDFFTHGIDGIVDHLPLYKEENRLFLEHVIRPDAFRFTIIRNPVEQFMSYFEMFKKNYQKIEIPSFNDTVVAFHKVAKNGGNMKVITSSLHPLYSIITNSQSRELGWDGQSNASHSKAVEYMRSLDFVGLTDDIPNTWKMLLHRLGWSRCLYFGADHPPVSRAISARAGVQLHAKKHRSSVDKLDKVTTEQREMIESFQWADRIMYEAAKQKFEDYKSKNLDSALAAEKAG